MLVTQKGYMMRATCPFFSILHGNVHTFPIRRFFCKTIFYLFFSFFLVLVFFAELGSAQSNAAVAKNSRDIDRFVGKPVDVASSAYSFFANRPINENSPESWLALKYFARIPLNRPMNAEDAVKNPTLKKVLASFLWEEIRPITQIKFQWAADAKKPDLKELNLTILLHKGSASSWWNNLAPQREKIEPTVSADGLNWTFDLNTETCGVILALENEKTAADYDVPKIEIFTPFLWKAMDVEIEWGFEPNTVKKDYSGRIESYDGRIAELISLPKDQTTKVGANGSWTSTENSSENSKAVEKRRGLQFHLLYSGVSKWKKEQPKR